jgi:ADP-ribosylglycohydrolase
VWFPDGVAGAVAVAVAAGLASSAGAVEPRAFLDQVLQLTPPGRVHDGMWAARGLAHVPYAKIAVHELGNGRYTSAHDTVPFALWAAARNLDDFEAAFWATAQTGGDVDTTCAIVGGVLGARLGLAGLPAAWQAAREPLPAWFTAQFSGAGRG